MEDYMDRPKERKILESYENLIMLIKKAKETIFLEEQFYQNTYIIFIEMEDIYYPTKLVKRFNPDELTIYMYIRLIGYFEKVKDIDFISHRKEDLDQLNDDGKMELIMNIN